MGLEPTTLGTTNRCSNQLSYNHHKYVCKYNKVFIITNEKNVRNINKLLRCKFELLTQKKIKPKIIEYGLSLFIF